MPIKYWFLGCAVVKTEPKAERVIRAFNSFAEFCCSRNGCYNRRACLTKFVCCFPVRIARILRCTLSDLTLCSSNNRRIVIMWFRLSDEPFVNCALRRISIPSSAGRKHTAKNLCEENKKFHIVLSLAGC